jgi:hypothetical protein
MSGWTVFGIIVGVLIIAGLAMNLRDIRRYLRIRSM